MTVPPAESNQSRPAGFEPSDVEPGQRADRFVADLTALMAVSSRPLIEPVLRGLLASARGYLGVERIWLCGSGYDVVVGAGPQRPWQTVTITHFALSVTALPADSPPGRLDRTARAIAGALGSLLNHLDVESRLAQAVNVDDVTGLLNRRSMQEALHARLTDGSPGPVALLRCDIDHMGALNNVLGVDAGDQFLKITARRLREVIGRNEVAGRVSGDQLAVVSSPSSEQQALALAARIQQAISEPVAIRPRPSASAVDTDAQPAGVVRTTSIGIGIGMPGQTAPGDVEQFAVASVSEAKALGGATTVAYSDAMRRRQAVRAEVELRLPLAMSDGGLVLFFQPEVDLLTTRLLGAEALVRWYHPTLGLLLPGSFIDTVETSPYAVTFGNWVLDRACRQWSSWLRSHPDNRDGDSQDGPPRQVRVNITATQLMSVDFVATVERTLQRYRLPARYLNLELTERDVVRDIDAAARTVEALSALGVGVAIDDFGTGYSSLAQLKNFVVNAVKVDRSFVSDIATDSGDRSIVAAIVSLAHSLGLDVVAEGVQDQAAIDVLTQLGCRRGQGFLFAPPLPPEEFEPLLAAGITGYRAG